MTGTLGKAGSVVARAGGSVVRHLRSALGSSAPPAGGQETGSGWLAVTVLCDPSSLDAGRPPEPLAQLGSQVEVRVRPAPGDKGAELAARLRDEDTSGTAPERLSGQDGQAELRSALRRAKQLIEVGEVLVVDPVPHGERPATPQGEMLEEATKAAPGAGVR